MSHTGRVHEGDASPGIIRVITTGYAIDKDGVLEFRKPPILPTNRNNKTSEELRLFKAQERFILYEGPIKEAVIIEDQNKKNDKDENGVIQLRDKFPAAKQNNKYLKYGLGVKFNLKLTKVKNNQIDTKFQDKNYAEQLQIIQRDLKLQNFFFKYIATDVQCLINEFILSDFLKVIRPLDFKSSETYLDQIKVLEEHNFRYHYKISCDVEHEKIKKFDICKIKIRSAEEFDLIYGEPKKVDEVAEDNKGKGIKSPQIKVCSDVDDEIDKKGEHSISDDKELPTFVKIMPNECQE